MTRHRKSEQGITLVETLMALLIIALLSTAGGVMLIQSLRSSQSIEERAKGARELQTALSYIRDDFSSFVPRSVRSEGSAEVPSLFEGHPVRFDGRIATFVRNGWSNPGDALRGDLQRVEYRFEDNKLIRRSWSSPDAAPGSRVSDQVLLADLDSLSVRYGREQIWRSEWIVPASGADATLPDKIEFIIRFSTDDTLTARFRMGLRQ